MPYPKRLIEVDLPIKRISAHARREKSIRHGHISTLHIWWARRPLAACRAVLCAALWPDPADPLCPPAFRNAAAELIIAFAKKASTTKLNESCSQVAMGRWLTLARPDAQIDLDKPNHLNLLRYSLLDFIADFANWDNSTQPDYLATARALTQAAHESLGGAPGTRPLVVDPFAGGGAIPLEALRVGADAFASDLNPVAVLLNKVVLEYIPKYGKSEVRIQTPEGGELVLRGLAEMVRYWGNWIKAQAEKELAEFYPKDPDGSTPIAYLWARTIRCEGPGCGAEVPLMRSLWLAKKGERSVALRLVPDTKHKRVDFEIIQKSNSKWVLQSEIKNPKFKIPNPSFDGTVKRGSATCPVCGYTTPVTRVRAQLKDRKGGAHDARLFCVVTIHSAEQGRFYRLPTQRDLDAVHKAAEELERRKSEYTGALSLVPNEEFTGLEPRRIPLPQYGIVGFESLYTQRQALVLTTLFTALDLATDYLAKMDRAPLAIALKTLLVCAIDRIADQMTSLVIWASTLQVVTHTFGRQALPIAWDFVEPQPFAGAGADFGGAVEWVSRVCERETLSGLASGHIESASAMSHPLPDDSADLVCTDPPYYYSIPYSDLSDFFYVWMRRALSKEYPALFANQLAPKESEIVQNLPHSEVAHLQKSREFYERGMTNALSECARIARPDAIGVVVFAHTETEAWEALLNAVISAGWCVTASWPIDTERTARVIAQRQSTLGSSVHLVCRPRENPDGSRRADAVGDWRDVLAELPGRIKDWMPRLMQEGVVGADAIFACIGPALEIFSRNERVEKADGTVITLHEYLEHVWAAVGREALNQIFAGADTSGFEEDGRLTVLWLWTMSGNDEGRTMNDESDEKAELGSGDERDESPKGKPVPGGFALEYDTARKLAQGIGAHLETLGRPGGVAEVKGDKARLLAVSERRKLLLGGKSESGSQQSESKGRKGRKSSKQLALEGVEESVGSLTPVDDEGPVTAGETTLDRIHQAMLLFNESRSDALKRLLVEDGVGQDQRFWRLAQALSALYPSGSQEKRWVDGVLARKKGLGL